MNIENINPDDYNQIDLECNVIDDDSTSFKNFTSNSPINHVIQSDEYIEEEYRTPVKTGIMLDFSDDDFSSKKRIPTISADIIDNEVRITRNNCVDINADFEAQDVNEIDMETSSCEDDDFGYTPQHKHKINDIDDDKVFFDDDAILDIQEEKKKTSKSISYEDVEEDYWKNLKKKYEKKNKNGHNNHFHIVGDMNQELKYFNNGREAEITPATNVNNALFGDITASVDAGNSSTGDSSAAGADGGAGTSESFNEKSIKINTNQYDKMLSALFDIIGFDVLRNSDGTYVAIDSLEDTTPEILANDLPDLIEKLKPYIDDCFVYPLEAATNEKFNTYGEWVTWYKNKNMQKKYPKCAEDIKYCDLIANHINDCYVNQKD